MAPKPKRLLLSVDGSKRAMQTVSYAGEEDAFKGMRIVLFHVFNSIPDAYYDLEKEPKSVKVVRHVRSWEANQRKSMDKFMQNAKAALIEAGHAEPAIEIKIQNRKKGVARDIIIEAHKGYDAVLIRRRGATALRNVVVGSVTGKLLEKLTFMPVLIAGRKPVNKKLLLAVDGSACATRAVQFVADILGSHTGYQLQLLHVIRGGRKSDLDLFQENGITESKPIFEAATRILTAGGFAASDITSKTITGVLSRAGAIVDEAEKGGWGTIVLGRRGLSRVKEFFIGRVSNKVIYAGRKDTVWLVT
jgi:nucleotide-binding universal stress UspA family protein